MPQETNLHQARKLGVPPTDAVSAVADKAEVDPSTIDEALFHFQTIQEVSHACSRNSGGWTTAESAKEQHARNEQRLSLMRNDLAEALEGLRNNLDDTELPHRKAIECKLADALIHIFDFAGGYDLDLSGALIEKLAYHARQREAL